MTSCEADCKNDKKESDTKDPDTKESDKKESSSECKKATEEKKKVALKPICPEKLSCVLKKATIKEDASSDQVTKHLETLSKL